jgi:hypothetical protein
MSDEPLVIERAELVRIIDEASAGVCAESTREKLRRVAETTGVLAVGWFHCDGVQCPARQARRTNQRFQSAFDTAMAERFERETFNPASHGVICEPFIVEVRP